jgi:hypothetical protein
MPSVLLTFLCSFVEATASQTAPGSRLLNRRVGFPPTSSGSTPGPPLSSQLHDAGARPPPDALALPPPLAVAPSPLHDAGARPPPDAMAPPPPLAVAPLPPLHDAGARPSSDVICPPPPMLLSGAGGKHFCVIFCHVRRMSCSGVTGLIGDLWKINLILT